MQSLEPWSSGHYVYAIGRLRARFPKEEVEQKYQQLLTPADMSAPTQEQRLYNVLSRPDNVSLAREMDWLLEVQDVATYRLQPRSTTEFQLMLDALAPDELAQTGYDVVIGAQKPQADGGEDLPVVSVHRLYHFTEESLVESIPLPQAIARIYTDASGGALRYYTSVDVTGQSPFLVTRLQPYFER